MSKRDFRKRIVNVVNDFEGWVDTLSWESLLLFIFTSVFLYIANEIIREAGLGALVFVGASLLLIKGVKWLNDNF